MLVVSFLELIPEAAGVAGPWRTIGATALGLLFIAAMDPLISHCHLVGEEGAFGLELKSASLLAFGLILHDLPEGFAMANPTSASPNSAS